MYIAKKLYFKGTDISSSTHYDGDIYISSDGNYYTYLGDKEYKIFDSSIIDYPITSGTFSHTEEISNFSKNKKSRIIKRHGVHLTLRKL